MAAAATQPGPLVQLPVADFIFGSTSGMQEARASLEASLHSELPVLIEGESGTGKEIVARYLHVHSSRAKGPFVRLNCGAIRGSWLMGEIVGLPGHEKSYLDLYPGIDSFETAASGTVFLDEFADMNLDLQGNMLQHFRAHTSIGRGDEHARVLFATSIDLERAVSEKRVLGELATAFVHRIRLLPLRERKMDLPQLCNYLLGKFAVNFGRPVPRLSRQVLEMFEQWDWPGNIRELENWIARIVIFGTEEVIAAGVEPRPEGMSIGTRRHGLRVNLTRSRRARRHR